MKLLIVCDAQHNPSVGNSSASLHRGLRDLPSGGAIKPSLFNRGFDSDLEHAVSHGGDECVLNIHIHQDAHFAMQRHEGVWRASFLEEAKGKRIPVIISCHEMTRVEQEEDRERLCALLAYADYATFTTEADRALAISRVPTLTMENTGLLPVAGTHLATPDMAEEKLQALEQGETKLALFHGSTVHPRKGLENFLECVRRLPPEIRVFFGGETLLRHPEYAAAFSQHVRTIEHDRPFDTWLISPHGISNDVFQQALWDAGFTYQPFPEGASPHSSIIPACARAGIIVLSHRGKDTPAPHAHDALDSFVVFVDGPEHAARTIEELRNNPERMCELIRAGSAYAREHSQKKRAEIVANAACALHDARHQGQAVGALTL